MGKPVHAKRRIHLLSQEPVNEAAVSTADVCGPAPRGSLALPGRALNSVAAHTPAEKQGFPVITGARLTGLGVEVFLARAVRAMPPFQVISRTAWRLDPSSRALLDEQAARHFSPPCPALVTLGDDQRGAHLLVNLTTAGAIVLHGSPEHVREFLTRMRAPGRRIEDHRMPQVILFATPLTAVQVAAIRELACADTVTANLAAIVGADDGAFLAGSWKLQAAPGQFNPLPAINCEVVLQRLSADPSGHLTERAGTSAETLGPDPRIVPAARQEQETIAPTADPDFSIPVVCVLGRVLVTGRDTAAIGSGKRNLLPELAAYLRLNPGSTAEEVSRAMGGPRGPWTASTRASNMSRLRAWLGRDPDGRNYVPALGEGQLYTLSPGVGCDWEIFRHLASRGLKRCNQGTEDSGIAYLQAAMGLVRGQPFSGGCGPHSYTWAEFRRQEMISAIIEVAHTLAVKLIEAGDPAGARVAATKGLSVEPGSERLYRALFTAEHQAGNAAGIEDAAGRLMVTLAELDLDMEPRTADLLSGLRDHRHGSAVGNPSRQSRNRP